MFPQKCGVWLLMVCGVAGAQARPAADTVLVHGTVLTVDAKDSVAQALAVRGGRIVAVGADDAVMRLIGPGTRVIDLQGRTATPGLIDTHGHYGEAGSEDLYNITLSDATSIAEIVRRVKARVAKAKPGEWIVGRGWDEGKLAEKRYLYAADLDAVSPDNPVVMTNATGHYLTANSVALRMAKIGDETKNAAGGTVDRDARGHVTGVLKEDASQPVRALIPPAAPEQIRAGILKEAADLHAEGVTAVKDTASARVWEAYRELNHAGKLDLRVCMLWRAGETMDSARAVLAQMRVASPRQRAYDGRLATCGAKIFMDGSAISRTAWSYDPWDKEGLVDGTNTGYPGLDPEVYRSMVRMFHQAGVSVGTHAIGDKAIDWVVDTYALVLKEKPTAGLRDSIIHAYLPTKHATDTMATLQKTYDAGYPEVQPVFLYWLGKSMPPNFGAERLARTMPLKTYLEHGVRWGSGSDYGVAPLAPRLGMWAAVEREAIGGAHPFGMAEAVDVHTALKSYTAWAARLIFLEGEVGTLEVGKWADIAVWDRNPYAVAGNSLKDLRCEMTFVDGKVVFTRAEP
jgi:predicted amidohydrolase YtcJ